LLDDTVAKNIAFGVEQQKINFRKINKIIKICDLEQFAEDQSNGINTIIGNRGIRISGGQKQRLGFARALYSEPKILFIDEATSNLDSITEKKIINNIFNNYNNITIVAITHKIKNLKNFKKIFLLSDGKIVKKGNYNVINKFYKKINKK
jgi:ABC-type multidrug transport system fused ATPase/permease subunit